MCGSHLFLLDLGGSQIYQLPQLNVDLSIRLGCGILWIGDVEKLLSGATIEEVNEPASIFEEAEKTIDAVHVDGAWRRWIEKLILEPLET